MLQQLCEICRRNPCHPRCPNYIEKKSDKYCDVCGKAINVGELYIENEKDKYLHYECIPGTSQLLDWLEINVKELV